MGVCAEALRGAIAVATSAAPATKVTTTFAIYPHYERPFQSSLKGNELQFYTGRFGVRGRGTLPHKKYFSHADEHSHSGVKQTPPDIALQPSAM